MMAEVIPPVTLTITTYELVEGVLRATVNHEFFGNTEDEARKVLEAHRKTDAFFDASFKGNFRGIILVNSEEVCRERKSSLL